MAALLVILGVMAVMLTVAMPVWRQLVQREKEAELVFRGQQYARAIGLFQRKYANAFPPNLDVLVSQRFLRKKYKDPMVSDGEFQLLYQGSTSPGAGPASRDDDDDDDDRPPGQPARPTAAPSMTAGARGGIIGVASKSKEKSIRLFNGRDRYSDWQFVYVPATDRPDGAPGAARPGPTGPGSRPGGPARPGLVRPPGSRPPGNR